MPRYKYMTQASKMLKTGQSRKHLSEIPGELEILSGAPARDHQQLAVQLIEECTRRLNQT